MTRKRRDVLKARKEASTCHLCGKPCHWTDLGSHKECEEADAKRLELELAAEIAKEKTNGRS